MTVLSYHNPITGTKATCTLEEAIAAMDIAPSAEDKNGFVRSLRLLENADENSNMEWMCTVDGILWRLRRAVMGDLIQDEFNNLTDEELVATEMTYAAYLHMQDIMEDKLKRVSANNKLA